VPKFPVGIANIPIYLAACLSLSPLMPCDHFTLCLLVCLSVCPSVHLHCCWYVARCRQDVCTYWSDDRLPSSLDLENLLEADITESHCGQLYLMFAECGGAKFEFLGIETPCSNFYKPPSPTPAPTKSKYWHERSAMIFFTQIVPRMHETLIPALKIPQNLQCM